MGSKSIEQKEDGEGQKYHRLAGRGPGKKLPAATLAARRFPGQGGSNAGSIFSNSPATGLQQRSAIASASSGSGRGRLPDGYLVRASDHAAIL